MNLNINKLLRPTDCWGNQEDFDCANAYNDGILTGYKAGFLAGKLHGKKGLIPPSKDPNVLRSGYMRRNADGQYQYVSPVLRKN